MKTNFAYLSLCFLCLLWACAPQKPLPTALEAEKPAEIKMPADQLLFESAEDSYVRKSYEAARDQYAAYLRQFPQGDAAALVLMRLGEIHTILKAYETAREAYRKLIDEHPEDALVSDAKVGILETYNGEGKFNEAIQYSFGIPDKTFTEGQLLRKETLLGDAFLAIGSWANAFYFYGQVYSRSTGPIKDHTLIKLKDLLPQLTRVQTTHLLSWLEDPVLRGHLLYQLGLLNIQDVRTEYAIEALNRLADEYPEHEQAEPAKALLVKIYQSSIQSPYTIACLLPLSGPYNIYGNRALNGIELAFGEYSRNHAQSPIRIVIKDTGSDPHQAMLAVQEIDQENAAAILGPIITAESAAYEAQSRGIPIILFTQKEDVTRIGNFVFRNFITPKMQVDALTEFALKKHGLNRFAILYPNDNYGKIFMNLFWDALLEAGGQVAGVESFDPEQTDFAEPIKKLVGLHYPIPEDLDMPFELLPERLDDTHSYLHAEAAFSAFFSEYYKNIPELFYHRHEKAYGPLAAENGLESPKRRESEPIIDFEALFIPDAPKKAGLIIPQLAFYDIEKVLLIGTNLWHSGTLLEMSRQYVQGAVLPDGFFDKSSEPRVQAFTRAFERTFGTKPGFIEAVAYDSAGILFQVLSNTDIQFKSRLKDELLDLAAYPGVTGTTSFDYDGDALKKPYILKVQGNRFVEVQTP
jgi:ABC-type branched-subunit amino acid transport system substrate-binding protein